MNAIRKTTQINNQELAEGTSISASWHNDYNDTAYIYIGGLESKLTEMDIATVFSQFGNPTHIKLSRDPKTGKSRGFAWLKYEDQRSTVLAVDNFNGVELLGRTVRVDHTYYESRDEEGDAKEVDMLNKARDQRLGGGGGGDDDKSRGARSRDNRDSRSSRDRQSHRSSRDKSRDKSPEARAGHERRSHHRSRRPRDDREDGSDEESSSRRSRDEEGRSRRSRDQDRDSRRSRRSRDDGSRERRRKRSRRDRSQEGSRERGGADPKPRESSKSHSSANQDPDLVDPMAAYFADKTK